VCSGYSVVPFLSLQPHSTIPLKTSAIPHIPPKNFRNSVYLSRSTPATHPIRSAHSPFPPLRPSGGGHLHPVWVCSTRPYSPHLPYFRVFRVFRGFVSLIPAAFHNSTQNPRNSAHSTNIFPKFPPVQITPTPLRHPLHPQGLHYPPPPPSDEKPVP
jgi:hypothetical protein